MQSRLFVGSAFCLKIGSQPCFNSVLSLIVRCGFTSNLICDTLKENQDLESGAAGDEDKL